jgi:hypothetical protein
MNRNDEATLRVTRGAQLLDEKVPGWADRIDVSKLEMGSAFDCVAGQMYRVAWNRSDAGYWSPYAYGMAELFGTRLETTVFVARRHGFESGGGLSSWDLQLAWHDAIRARQVVKR